MLEASQYEDNSFLTLTFDDDHLPDDLSVRPADISAFMKRFRNYAGKVRYFGVGEYGDMSGRPHYHLALFGYARCAYGITRNHLSGRRCCPHCDAVRKAWPFGGIVLGSLERASAQYIAGYVVKKMTRPDDERLCGRLPEFARMSLRPGIGLGMMHELSSELLKHKLDERMIDVPLALQHGAKKWPLGRYLRRKLRTFVGRSPDCPSEVLEKHKEELSDLRKTAFDNSRPFKEEIAKAGKQARLNMEARNRIYSKKKVTI